MWGGSAEEMAQLEGCDTPLLSITACRVTDFNGAHHPCGEMASCQPGVDTGGCSAEALPLPAIHDIQRCGRLYGMGGLGLSNRILAQRCTVYAKPPRTLLPASAGYCAIQTINHQSQQDSFSHTSLLQVL